MFGDLWDQIDATVGSLMAQYRSQIDKLPVELKRDSTLLTQADIRIQDAIVRIIRDFDLGAKFVAEEISSLVPTRIPYDPAGRSWVLDPIDGTKQFVTLDAVEFCSVVCLVEDGVPIAALIFAPEIGPDRSPVSVRVDGPGAVITVNGRPANVKDTAIEKASVTRSAGADISRVERALRLRGWDLKTRTTSQSLDMVRTSTDLASVTDGRFDRFGLFYRERQKFWDGAAGMCLALSAELCVADSGGERRGIIELLSGEHEPVIPSTLITSRAILDLLSADDVFR